MWTRGGLCSGLKAVPAGQSEAAAALGLSKWTTFIKVIGERNLKAIERILISIRWLLVS